MLTYLVFALGSPLIKLANHNDASPHSTLNQLAFKSADAEVDPLPPIIQSIIKRLINWGVMPESCRPDSCIVNIYDEVGTIPLVSLTLLP